MQDLIKNKNIFIKTLGSGPKIRVGRVTVNIGFFLFGLIGNIHYWLRGIFPETIFQNSECSKFTESTYNHYMCPFELKINQNN